MTTDHSYLFEPGRWTATGTHCDASGRATVARGSSEITHASDRWRSENPALGTLEGTFVAVDDVILSSYASEDGRFEGAETVRRIEPGRYANRGVLLDRGKPVSRWSMELVRED